MKNQQKNKMKNYYKAIILLCIILLINGCATIIKDSHIPHCRETDVIGMDCHDPQNLFDKERKNYNYSNAICKEIRMIGFNDKTYYCFDTLQNITKEFKQIITTGCKDYCKELCGIESKGE